MRKLFQIKPLQDILADSRNEKHQLKKTLSRWSLVSVGIGCIIGTGIFVLTGQVAIANTGPGILLSLAICAGVCILAALCYAEFSSLLPISGSAYTYTYATMGEIFAWMIGWILILEYALSAAAVASGWSSYFINLLQFLGIGHFPEKWVFTPFETIGDSGETGIMNLPAICITLVLTILLMIGIRESARTNNLMVLIKVGIALLFIVIGFAYVNPGNWFPLVPDYIPAADGGAATDWKRMELWKLLSGNSGSVGFGGLGGIMMGAAILFFAYIGFDSVSTASEEAHNPEKDIPFGIIVSLLIATVLYMCMALVFTGIVRCDGVFTLEQMGVDKGAPLVYAFKQVNNVFINRYAAFLLVLGGLAAMTSVILVSLLGQTRVFFSMARDGLLPSWTAKVHQKYATPFTGTLVTGILTALVAGFLPLNEIAELTNIGTLTAFVFVAGGILYLRKHHPNSKPGFRTPWVPVIPILSMITCLALMFSLPAITWLRYLVYLGLGAGIYFLYGIRHSRLRQGPKA